MTPASAAPTSRLRALKLRWLETLEKGGLFAAVGRSQWRTRRLAILCYHGVSKRDEHEWNNELYMPPELLRSRMALLAETGCTVVSLEDGLRRLREGTLPPRAVAITFDDGISDFQSHAWPILAERGFPGTVYLTSSYAVHQLPIFNLLCQYWLWQGRGHGTWDASGLGVNGRFDLNDANARGELVTALREHCRRDRLCVVRRHDLALRLAHHLGVDPGPALAARQFVVMNGDELKDVATGGASVDLHTHRHRVPREREALVAELQINQDYIRRYTGRTSRHFCYPSGVWWPELFSWLGAFGLESAVVGEKAYATAATERMQLPRFVDTCPVTPLEFRAWVTGGFALLPRRGQSPPKAA